MGLILGEYGFLRWWSVLIPERIVNGGKNVAALVSDTFAIKAMAEHIGEAIFQDPTWQGRLIGIAIRIGRIGAGLFAETIVFIGTGFTIVLWYGLPILALIGVLRW